LFSKSGNGFQSEGPKIRGRFQAWWVISSSKSCRFAVVGIRNVQSNDKALILDLLSLLFPINYRVLRKYPNRNFGFCPTSGT